MKLLIVGDTHAVPGATEALGILARKHSVELIVQCGDLGYWPRDPGGRNFLDTLAGLPVPIYFADGNHEDHNMLDHVTDETYEVSENVWHVPRGVVHVLDGLRFLFFGGAASVDRTYRTPGFSWFPRELPGPRAWDRLTGLDSVDVVIAHDSPHLVDYDYPPADDAFWPEADIRIGEALRAQLTERVLEKLTPSLWFCGHHHRRQTDTVLGCEVHTLNEFAGVGSGWAVTLDTKTWEVEGVL